MLVTRFSVLECLGVLDYNALNACQSAEGTEHCAANYVEQCAANYVPSSAQGGLNKDDSQEVAMAFMAATGQAIPPGVRAMTGVLVFQVVLLLSISRLTSLL